MNFLVAITKPIKRVLGKFCSLFPFSVAELLVVLAILGILFIIVWIIIRLVRCEKKVHLVYQILLTFIASALSLWLALSIMLGATYYSDSFQDQSGIYAEASSVEDLYKTAKYFAEQASTAAAKLPRDGSGQLDISLDEIFNASSEVYSQAELQFPFLSMQELVPKRVFFSKVMSYFNYTGFYFPFTGEANINVDAPICLIPSTIAHELAHQRGIASEQEANFVAILASTTSGNEIYEYSGWLLGYIHLINALYKQDYDLFLEVYQLVSEPMLADLRANNAYWEQYETSAAEVSSQVYDTMLKSYGQSLGVQSYGAVVDLLIAYYLPC